MEDADRVVSNPEGQRRSRLNMSRWLSTVGGGGGGSGGSGSGEAAVAGCCAVPLPCCTTAIRPLTRPPTLARRWATPTSRLRAAVQVLYSLLSALLSRLVNAAGPWAAPTSGLRCRTPAASLSVTLQRSDIWHVHSPRRRALGDPDFKAPRRLVEAEPDVARVELRAGADRFLLLGRCGLGGRAGGAAGLPPAVRAGHGVRPRALCAGGARRRRRRCPPAQDDIGTRCTQPAAVSPTRPPSQRWAL